MLPETFGHVRSVGSVRVARPWSRHPFSPLQVGSAVAVAMLLTVVAIRIGGGESGPATPSASPVASPAVPANPTVASPSTQIIVGEITVHITDVAIVPEHFESAVGRDVTITVVNAGSRPHSFIIDELDVDLRLDSGETAMIELEQPRLGNYRYYSDLPGDEGLEGTMTIFI